MLPEKYARLVEEHERYYGSPEPDPASEYTGAPRDRSYFGGTLGRSLLEKRQQIVADDEGQEPPEPQVVQQEVPQTVEDQQEE